jgi:hypothetical protein
MNCYDMIDGSEGISDDRRRLILGYEEGERVREEGEVVVEVGGGSKEIDRGRRVGGDGGKEGLRTHLWNGGEKTERGEEGRGEKGQWSPTSLHRRGGPRPTAGEG